MWCDQLCTTHNTTWLRSLTTDNSLVAWSLRDGSCWTGRVGHWGSRCWYNARHISTLFATLASFRALVRCGRKARFKNYVRKNIITTWHLQLSYYMRRYSSDVYLGMPLVQNGGSYLRNVLAHVGKTSETVANWNN